MMWEFVINVNVHEFLVEMWLGRIGKAKFSNGVLFQGYNIKNQVNLVVYVLRDVKKS